MSANDSEQGQRSGSISQDDKTRKLKYWGLLLTTVGFACELLPFPFIVGHIVPESIQVLGLGLSVLGLALYAKAKGHSPVYGSILGLVPLLGPLGGLIQFTLSKPKQSKPIGIRRVLRWIVGGLVVCIGCIIIFAVTLFIVSATGARQMEQQSAPLIQALSKYKKDHAQLPETLDQLVPQYVSEIPKCKSSSQQRIIYFYRKEQDAYDLNCYTAMFNKHRYKSITAEWDDWD